MTGPLVSTIIPVFNRESFLQECIESVLAAEYSSVEAVVVDDGSTDDSPNIAADYTKRFPDRVKLLVHPGHTNKGVACSRNLGIKRSSGDLITFLDSDDLMRPWRFNEAVRILGQYPQVDGVLDRVEFSDHETGRVLEVRSYGELSSEEQLENEGKVFHPSGLMATGCLLVRKGLFRESGVFQAHKSVGEDINLWWRMYAIGRLVPGTETRPVAEIRKHQGNMSGFDPALINPQEFAQVYRWAKQRRVRTEKLRYLRRRYISYVLYYLAETRRRGGCLSKEAYLLGHAFRNFPDLRWDERFLRNFVRLFVRKRWETG